MKIYLADMTVVFCLLLIAVYETLLQTGLIRTNTRYDQLFRASAVPAWITDESGRLCLASETAADLPAQVPAGAENPVMLTKNLRVSYARVRGGRVYWQEDLSEINTQLAHLREISDRLSENNDLVRAELEERARRLRIDEQTRLFDLVNRAVQPQLQQIQTLLEDENGARSKNEILGRICVLGTYIKRRSNLLLISEGAADCPAKELSYCLRESAEALSATGCACACHCDDEGRMLLANAVLIYDAFESLIEPMLPGLSGLLIRLQAKDGQVHLKLRADHALVPSAFPFEEALRAAGGAFRIASDSDGTTFSITVPGGVAA